MIELSVAFAIIGVVAGLGLFYTATLVSQTDLEGETETLAVLLMRARMEALIGNDLRGVCYDKAHHAYAFLALPHADREYGALMRVGARTEVTGLPDCDAGGISFSVLSATTTPALIVLVQDKRSARIEINREGMISW